MEEGTRLLDACSNSWHGVYRHRYMEIVLMWLTKEMCATTTKYVLPWVSQVHSGIPMRHVKQISRQISSAHHWYQLDKFRMSSCSLMQCPRTLWCSFVLCIIYNIHNEILHRLVIRNDPEPVCVLNPITKQHLFVTKWGESQKIYIFILNWHSAKRKVCLFVYNHGRT